MGDHRKVAAVGHVVVQILHHLRGKYRGKQVPLQQLRRQKRKDAGVIHNAVRGFDWVAHQHHPQILLKGSGLLKDGPGRFFLAVKIFLTELEHLGVVRNDRFTVVGGDAHQVAAGENDIGQKGGGAKQRRRVVIVAVGNIAAAVEHQWYDLADVFQIVNLGFGIAVQTEVVLNGNVVKADDAQTVKQKGKLRLYHDADKSFGVRGFLQQNKVEGAIDSRSRMKNLTAAAGRKRKFQRRSFDLQGIFVDAKTFKQFQNAVAPQPVFFSHFQNAVRVHQLLGFSVGQRQRLGEIHHLFLVGGFALAGQHFLQPAAFDAAQICQLINFDAFGIDKSGKHFGKKGHDETS